MRTPKSLYVQQRRLYHPELLKAISGKEFTLLGS
jgi:hypothetical protein